MYTDALRSSWVEINLSNLDYNIKNIISLIGDGIEVIGVIKADGYGHGSIKVAEVLRENGVGTFAVATLPEAIELRENGAKERIIKLGLTSDIYADTIADYDITPVVCSSTNATAISNAAERAGKTVTGLVAVDTGMGRIGYRTDDPEAIMDIQKIDALSHFKIRGMFSHFATADDADKAYAYRQEKRFNEFCKKLTAAGIAIPRKTIANSAALMELPTTHFDAVRPGIILYGCYPGAQVDRSLLSIKPVMSVKATVVHLKTIPKGESVSYGRKFVAKRDSVIATLSIGYADGYPRPYSATGKVIINGAYAPIAGNICMDQCMIDVTDVPGVKLGDEVIIMGSDGDKSVTADDIANATGTINYEIVCAFGQRLPRVYVK
jgi:alanine racemase